MNAKRLAAARCLMVACVLVACADERASGCGGRVGARGRHGHAAWNETTPSRSIGAPDYGRMFAMDRVHEVHISHRRRKPSCDAGGPADGPAELRWRPARLAAAWSARRAAGPGGDAFAAFVGRVPPPVQGKSAAASCTANGLEGTCNAIPADPMVCVPAAARRLPGAAAAVQSTSPSATRSAGNRRARRPQVDPRRHALQGQLVSRWHRRSATTGRSRSVSTSIATRTTFPRRRTSGSTAFAEADVLVQFRRRLTASRAALPLRCFAIVACRRRGRRSTACSSIPGNGPRYWGLTR